jgi:hypothetical protein
MHGRDRRFGETRTRDHPTKVIASVICRCIAVPRVDGLIVPSGFIDKRRADWSFGQEQWLCGVALPETRRKPMTPVAGAGTEQTTWRFVLRERFRAGCGGCADAKTCRLVARPTRVRLERLASTCRQVTGANRPEISNCVVVFV